MAPARGQLVIVRNDPPVMASTSGTDDGEEELLYTMKRAAGKIHSAVLQSPITDCF